MIFKEMKIINKIVCCLCEDDVGKYFVFIGRIIDMTLECNSEYQNNFIESQDATLKIPLLAYNGNLFHLISIDNKKEYEHILAVVEAIA